MDNGSSSNIIIQAAYRDLGLEEGALKRKVTPLIGFSGEVKRTAREIIFPVYAEGINMYNMILGRPWIHHACLLVLLLFRSTHKDPTHKYPNMLYPPIPS